MAGEIKMIEHDFWPNPLKPILCFVGGKTKLTKIMRSGQLIPPHRVYVEPFFGGGSVFFAKPPAEVNVINDLDERLMGFYEEFREIPELDCDMSPDRERFYRLKEQLERRESLEPCDYFFLNRWSVNCRMEAFKKKPRCKSPGQVKTCGIATVIRDFEKYKNKLRRATILSEDFRNVIRKYDFPDTFFFIDPPYFAKDFPGARGCHYRMYGGCEVTPEEVRDAVRGIRGRFMITYPNTEKIRDTFKSFAITEASWKYSARAGKSPLVTELLITNYRIEHE